MEADRLEELLDHAVGKDAPADVRERVRLALQLAEKQGRKDMRLEAARATVSRKRFRHARRIMSIDV